VSDNIEHFNKVDNILMILKMFGRRKNQMIDYFVIKNDEAAVFIEPLESEVNMQSRLVIETVRSDNILTQCGLRRLMEAVNGG
jgi:hypothetical protein